MRELVRMASCAVERALLYLIGQQEDNGSFSDFRLPPGTSDAWMTGFVAVALEEASRFVPIPEAKGAVERAAEFLLGCQRPSGWGYNSQVATDGDSTAFAVRALLRAGHLLRQSPESLLQRYLDGQGHGHTFLDPQRMGAWAGGHADVTASIGLALHEARADASLCEQVVHASLASRDGLGIWRGYWWLRPFYATWLNLLWLRSAGALTGAVARSAREGILRLPGNRSAMDSAALLGILWEVSQATGEAVPAGQVECLLQLQRAEGGWPPSYCLILPPQRHECPLGRVDDGADLPCYADVRALFTTAVAVQVLARWCGR